MHKKYKGTWEENSWHLKVMGFVSDSCIVIFSPVTTSCKINKTEREGEELEHKKPSVCQQDSEAWDGSAFPAFLPFPLKQSAVSTPEDIWIL